MLVPVFLWWGYCSTTSRVTDPALRGAGLVDPDQDRWSWVLARDSTALEIAREALPASGYDRGWKRKAGWFSLHADPWLFLTQDVADVREFSGYALMATGLRADEVERLWELIRNGRVGTRWGALVLADRWGKDGVALARCRDLLSGDPTEIAVACYALPIVTGHRLLESWNVTVHHRSTDLRGEELNRIFVSGPSVLVGEWLDWLGERDGKTVTDLYRDAMVRGIEDYPAFNPRPRADGLPPPHGVFGLFSDDAFHLKDRLDLDRDDTNYLAVLMRACGKEVEARRAQSLVDAFDFSASPEVTREDEQRMIVGWYVDDLHAEARALALDPSLEVDLTRVVWEHVFR